MLLISTCLCLLWLGGYGPGALLGAALAAAAVGLHAIRDDTKLAGNPVTLADKQVKSPADSFGYRQFQGIWNGQLGLFTVELRIDAGGILHWTSTFGNARAEGVDYIGRVGANFFITLPFIQDEPMRMRLTDGNQNLLTLVERNGTLLELHRGSPRRQDDRQ